MADDVQLGIDRSPSQSLFLRGFEMSADVRSEYFEKISKEFENPSMEKLQGDYLKEFLPFVLLALFHSLEDLDRYLRLAAALGARTRGAAAGDGVTAAAATAAAAAADGAAAPSQLQGTAGNLYPVKNVCRRF
ncbi:hypothetical protein KQX54_002752 [Cotesia glomerata]|uniref:Uncharacterized protein n=1 Tax=Cotesia glomerata TaxID=32391 RepID=A0AAV7IX13_COTGL|nr:hypothetical protein KQX54_002752 [Cotesia glomerata]